MAIKLSKSLVEGIIAGAGVGVLTYVVLLWFGIERYVDYGPVVMGGLACLGYVLADSFLGADL